MLLAGNGSSLPGTPVPPQADAADKRRAAPCRKADRAVSRTGRTIARRSLLCLVNRERRARGLRRLSPSRQVRRAADRHASEMVRKRFFSHQSPSGATLVVRVRRTGWLRQARRYALGEALGFQGRGGTPRKVFRRLMASAPHRAVLLNRGFRQIGVGVARGTPQGTRAGMTVTLDLGTRS